MDKWQLSCIMYQSIKWAMPRLLCFFGLNDLNRSLASIYLAIVCTSFLFASKCLVITLTKYPLIWDVLTSACNLSPQEAQAGGQGQPWLHSKAPSPKHDNNNKRPGEDDSVVAIPSGVSSASRASADLFKVISEAIVWLWAEGIRQKLGQWSERIHSLVTLEERILPIFQESSSEGCSLFMRNKNGGKT